MNEDESTATENGATSPLNGQQQEEPLFTEVKRKEESPKKADVRATGESSAILPTSVQQKSEPVAAPRSTATSVTPTSTSDAKSTSNQFIEIKVGEPKRLGEGMKAYIVYKVSTRTNFPYFRKSEFEVERRFSDFLGLRDKLADKHVHVGRIVPPAPEKDGIGNVKVKYAKDGESVSADDFVEKRRASLERYLNRTGRHGTLRADPDFREFLELDTELPKAKGTAALSGAGVRRLFNRVGDTVSKMTFRMDENDPVST